jgi:LysM repeat protein
MIGLFIGMTFEGNNQAKAQSYINELEDSWIQPVNGRITDTFGTRNGKHKGIDIAAPKGEKIVSVSDGKVTKSYYSNTYGHVVFVEHPEGYETVYAHLSKRMVDVGQAVKKGQELGIIGNTGVSTGIHLHFELHEGEWTYEKEHALDPLFVFDQDSSKKEQNTTYIKQKSAKSDDHSISVEKSVSDLNQVTDQPKKVITVMEGDTLWQLSQNLKVSVNSLQEWNKLDSTIIYPGQELTVFLSKDRSYVVKAGDTIQSIAEEFSMEPEAIKKANQLKTEKIYPQQVLLISKK